MYSCWSDTDFEAGVLNIRAKPDLDWTLKDHEERAVPPRLTAPRTGRATKGTP